MIRVRSMRYWDTHFTDGAVKTRTARSSPPGRRGTAATGSASDTRTGTTFTSGFVSRKCRFLLQSKICYLCEDSSKNTGAVEKISMIILSESTFIFYQWLRQKMILVCAKCIHLPNVTPPDNPVSTSKDLAPPELNPDVSFYSLKTLQFHCWDANVFPTPNIRRIFNLGCRIFRLMWWGCWTWWGYLFFNQMQTDLSTI